MKRVSVFATSIVLSLLPVLAAAQVPPVPPAPQAPPPPLPKPAPMPPLPPVVAVPYIDRFEIEEAVRAAKEQVERLDLDAIKRDAIEQSREAIEHAREAAEQAKVALKAKPFEFDFKFDFDFDSKFDLQGRGRDIGFAYAQGGGSEAGLYSQGRGELDRRQYERAVTYFDRVIAQKGRYVEGAMYWKAFAQYKLGKSDEALATLAELRKNYAQSRYIGDSKVLEADIRKPSPQSIEDDDIKLLALEGLKNADPELAITGAEGVLSKTNSLGVKKRALYVLAGIDQPRAHQILLSYAKGNGSPDLQMEAIRYLMTQSRRQNNKTTSAELQQIYNATQDVDVRRAVIDAYRGASDKGALWTIVNGKDSAELRARAFSGLTDLAAPQELWSLYQKEENKDLRLQMVRAFSSLGALDQLNQVLKIEKDPEVRRQAIRSLGNQKPERTGQMLIDMYGAEQDKDNRKAIISALGSQGNADGLVAIAKKETTLELKTEIVRRLSDMASRSKVAADYLSSIIK